MQLVVYCKECLKKNKLKIKASNRVLLKMKYGDNVENVCMKCNKKSRYGVNEITAEKGISSLIGFVIVVFLIGLISYFLWDYVEHRLSSLYLLPVGLLALLLIYAVMNKEMTNQVKNFNKS